MKSSIIASAARCSRGPGVVAAAAFASWASATELPLAQVELGGQRHAAYRAGDEIVSAPLPLSARLTRDASAPPPACAELDQSLTPFADTLEACTAEPDGNACDELDALVTALRFDPGSIGASSLTQLWRVTPDALTSDAAVSEALAAQLGVDASDVLAASGAERQGATPNGIPVIDPAGASWASRLIGLPGPDDTGLAYDAALGGWVTRDQVLACGISAGDVSVAWTQDTWLALEAAAPQHALTESQWLQIYAAVAEASPGAAAPAVQRALAIGRALGDALLAAGVDMASLPDRAQAVLGDMFVDDDLTRLRELSEIDASSPPARLAAVALSLAWQARGLEPTP